MAITSQQLWQMYQTALTDYVCAGSFDANKQVICFAGNTLTVDLANADPTISNLSIYQIGNMIPKWSPCYTPGPDLIGSYSTFLNYIDLGGDSNPNLDALINVASGDLTLASNNFQAQLAGAITNWHTMQQVNPSLTWAQYVQQYGAVYIAAKQAQDAAQLKYFQLLQQKTGVNFQTLIDAQSRIGFTGGARDTSLQNNYNMLCKFGTQAPIGSQKTLPGATPTPPASSLNSAYLPNFNLSGFTIDYQQWQVDSANNRIGATINVKGNSQANQMSSFGWSGSFDASVFGDFFTFNTSGNASSQTVKASWQSTNFNLKVSYTALKSYQIAPGSWFQSSMVSNYKNKLLSNPPKFFGQDGSLSLLPTEIILGFEPSIELTLDNQDYNDMKSAFQANATASLSIGPFAIGSASYSTYSDKSSMSYNDSSQTITIGPVKSTLPLLLGVICSKL